ncbi:MAG: polysaccharide deacetylase family protein [Labilithrix sp.]|nr:polysaccharide deacetylase family protein [Labilithrix sp.]
MSASSSSPRSSLTLRRLAAACVASGLVVLGACGEDRAGTRPLSGETLGASSQELRTNATYYVGAGTMAAKQLALTFDDGPGTRTAALSTYLKTEGIRAVFFVNGACIQAPTLPGNSSCSPPTANATAILAQLAADGHLVANHSTTHRNITSVPVGERVQELSETDALMVAHGATPWNRSLFRAPFGAWSTAVHGTLDTSTMSHYVGPIYWDIGGASDQYPAAAADWACFQGQLQNKGYATSTECGDAYLNEIDSVGRGIVLLHDPYGWAQGNTLDMVKYMVPLLKAGGYTFVRADEVQRIAADLPACADASCLDCSAAGAGQCTRCVPGSFLSGGSCAACATCAAGTYPSAACTATANTVCAACDASCAACAGPTAAECGACATGYFLDGAACEACTTCAAGSRTSAACSGTSDTACSPCAPGTASAAPGSATCATCAPGTFAATAGASTCASCGACDDGDACTTDVCSPTEGCTHTPIAGCDGASSGGDSSGGAPNGDAPSDDDQSGCRVARGGAAPSLAWLFAAAGVALVRRRARR